MKKIIVALFLVLFILGGFWYLEFQKITKDNFQPTDDNYEFVESEVHVIQQESDQEEVQILVQAKEEIESETTTPNVIESGISDKSSNIKGEDLGYENNAKISIYSPTQDQTFRAGETIKVKFSAPDNVETLLLLANVKGDGYDEDTLLYLKEDGGVRQFEYKIPEEAYTNVEIIVTGLGGGIPIQDTLELGVTPNTKVESISLLNNSLHISKGFVADVVLEITRTDGLRHLIYEDPDVTYEISNPTIAEWYDTNRFIGLQEGETEMVITYKDLSITIPVHVFISNMDFEGIPEKN